MGNKGCHQVANMTLNQLTEMLKQHGINISRSAVYLRLIPRTLQNLEAKRHVDTVPIQLRTHDYYKRKTL